MGKHLTQYVRNRSGRGGVRPRLIVLHTTEAHNTPGVGDLTALARWFDNPSAQASSHYGVDAEGNTIHMVPGSQKAWTCMAYNAVSLNIEQVGFASTKEADWFHGYMPGLKATAKICAEWGAQFGIPLARGIAVGGRVLKAGIVQHSNLGVAGGGHHDCGPGYPIGFVRRAARYYAEKSPNRRESLRRALNEQAQKYHATFG